MPTTTRLALPYPGLTDSPNGPTQIQALANALDNASVDLAEGTLAARPSPATRGRWYYATDVAVLYRDSGSTWRAVAGADVITANEIAADAVGTSEIAADAVGTSELAPSAVTNTEVAAGAGIAKSKLAALDIVNADVNAGAAIAKSKLAALTIVDSDVSAGAAIAEAKLALASDAAAGTASRRTLGTGASQAAAGNDSRFPAGVDIVDADIAAAAIQYSAYRTLMHVPLGFPALVTPGTFIPLVQGSGLMSSGNPSSGDPLALYFDSADYPSIGGKVPKMRVRVSCYTNGNASGSTFTAGFYPVSSVAGPDDNTTWTLGSVVGGSTVAFASPAVNSMLQGNSGDFTIPGNGHYVLGVLLTGSPAIKSRVILSMHLQLHWV